MSWELVLIKDALKRCYGLQDALKNGKDKNDKLLYEAALDSIRMQSGLSAEFINKNVEQILKIEL